jgi:hypothetical protein
MFVVAPVTRTPEPDADGVYGRLYLIHYEDEEHPVALGPIAQRDTREAAETLADALNKALAT